MTMMRTSYLFPAAGLCVLALFVSSAAQQRTAAPKFKFDPDWPKPLPNKWKLGGVTGLAVDKDDNVWVLNRPNDLTDIELEAELNPPLADCCVRPPAMIHIDKNGNVIGSFDAPQGHGMAVDSQGIRLHRAGHGAQVRSEDRQGGRREVPRAPETEAGRRRGRTSQMHHACSGSRQRGTGRRVSNTAGWARPGRSAGRGRR